MGNWLDPLHGSGYAFWSGIGGALVPPALVGVLIWVWPTRCQEFGCYRRARQRHTLHGYPVCRDHQVKEVEVKAKA